MPRYLTIQQKLQALSDKYYSNLPWEPKKGDYYTSCRNDLELYQIVEVTDLHIYTVNLSSEEPENQSKWSELGFLTVGFGPKRVLVSPYIFNL